MLIILIVIDADIWPIDVSVCYRITNVGAFFSASYSNVEVYFYISQVSFASWKVADFSRGFSKS